MDGRNGQTGVPTTPNPNDKDAGILPTFMQYSCTQCKAQRRIENEMVCASCKSATTTSQNGPSSSQQGGNQFNSAPPYSPSPSNSRSGGNQNNPTQPYSTVASNSRSGGNLNNPTQPYSTVASNSRPGGNQNNPTQPYSTGASNSRAGGNQNNPAQPYSTGNSNVPSITDEPDPVDLVGQRIPLGQNMCTIKKKITCCGEKYYAMESDKSMRGYNGQCPKCNQEHVYFAQPNRGFYASVSEIHGKIYGDRLSEVRAKGPKQIDELPKETGDQPPLDHPILGRNKGIEGDSNSCYMDSTIFCMFAYSRVFDSLLHMSVGKNKATKKLQKLLRENIVNVLRSGEGFVERDALSHLRSILSDATGDQSFKEMEKDPTEFLRALEGLFQYAPLQTIPPDQPPNDTKSNVITNIMWEMFDANPHQLTSTSIANIFRNSLGEIPAKLATIPPFLILIAPRHTRSERSYRYIIPDHQIVLDHKIVQLVCLECKQTNNNSDQSREFYFCNDCYSKRSSTSSTPTTDTTVMCYCFSCLKDLHQCVPMEELVEHHQPIQMKNVPYKLNLFAVLCIEKCHYVAFVKCHKADQRDEWLFFDSMSDRIQNEKNVSRVSPVSDFDGWIRKSEKEHENFFKDIDRRRSKGKPMSQEFSEDEMRQLRLFRDGAFFFYENPEVDYQ